MRYKPQKCSFCQIIPQNMSITIPLGVEPLTFVCLICLIFSSYVPTPPPLPRIPVNIVLYSYTTYPIILHIFCCTHHHASLSHLFCICINCPMHIFPLLYHPYLMSLIALNICHFHIYCILPLLMILESITFYTSVLIGCPRQCLPLPLPYPLSCFSDDDGYFSYLSNAKVYMILHLHHEFPQFNSSLMTFPLSHISTTTIIIRSCQPAYLSPSSLYHNLCRHYHYPP